MKYELVFSNYLCIHIVLFCAQQTIIFWPLKDYSNKIEHLFTSHEKAYKKVRHNDAEPFRGNGCKYVIIYLAPGHWQNDRRHEKCFKIIFKNIPVNMVFLYKEVKERDIRR